MLTGVYVRWRNRRTGLSVRKWPIVLAEVLTHSLHMTSTADDPRWPHRNQEDCKLVLRLSRDPALRIAKLKPVRENGVITASNASRLSVGASASVLVSGEFAARRELSPLGRYLGIAVAECAPEEMGIGPGFALPSF
jgi:hypothetical protein